MSPIHPPDLHFGPRERRATNILLLFVFMSRAAYMLRSDSQIATGPYLEDAFYMFQAAFHAANGHGFSVDGTHITNGVQPLLTFLYIPFFAFFDSKWQALRSTLLLTAFVEMLTVYMLMKVIRQLRVPQRDQYLTGATLAAAIWSIANSILLHSMNGQETGLYALLILVSVNLYRRLQETPTWEVAMFFGAALGLLVLARIDGVLLVAVYAAYHIWRNRSAAAVRQAAVFSLLAFLVSLPWWYYNLSNFGSLMPISGQSESIEFDLAANFEAAARAIADIIQLLIYVPAKRIGALTWLWSFAAIWVATLLLWRTNALRWLKEHTSAASLTPLVGFSLLLVVYYTLIFASPHFIPRYFMPLRVLWLITLGLIYPHLLSSFSPAFNRIRFLKITGFALVTVLIAFNIERDITAGWYRPTAPLYTAGQIALQLNPQTVAAYQSGIMSFSAANVTNLDGKVNFEAIQARKAGKFGQYIAAKNFDYIIDVDGIAKAMADTAARAKALYILTDSVVILKIYKHVRLSAK